VITYHSSALLVTDGMLRQQQHALLPASRRTQLACLGLPVRFPTGTPERKSFVGLLF
jgi:hypothetical protein